MILHGTCNNLSSRGRITIHQNHNLTFLEHPIAISRIFRARHSPTLGINDQIAALKKFVGDIDSCLQIAATILLKIENQILHALLLQVLKTLQELLMGGGAKTTDTDITDTWTNDISSIYRLHGNLIANHRELKSILDSLTHHTQMNGGTLRSAQALHDFFLRHLHTSNGGIIDRDDAVASNDAHFLRGSVGDGLNHEESILYHIELHTNALKVATERFVQTLHLLGCEITGVRIEFVEHTTDGILSKFLFIDTIYIKIGDGHLGKLQLAQW